MRKETKNFVIKIKEIEDTFCLIHFNYYLFIYIFAFIKYISK